MGTVRGSDRFVKITKLGRHALDSLHYRHQCSIPPPIKCMKDILFSLAKKFNLEKLQFVGLNKDTEACFAQ